MPANLVFRRKIWGARDNGIPPRSTPEFSIFRRLNWENKGVKIDGEFLSTLRFADDIFLCTETPQELQQMLQELSDESRPMGVR